MKDDSAEMLFQSFLWEAVSSSSDMARGVHSLLIEHFINPLQRIRVALHGRAIAATKIVLPRPASVYDVLVFTFQVAFVVDPLVDACIYKRLKMYSINPNFAVHNKEVPEDCMSLNMYFISHNSVHPR